MILDCDVVFTLRSLFNAANGADTSRMQLFFFKDEIILRSEPKVLALIVGYPLPRCYRIFMISVIVYAI